jgi:hypothetical protein
MKQHLQYSVRHIKNGFTLHEKNQTYRLFFLDSVQDKVLYSNLNLVFKRIPESTVHSPAATTYEATIGCKSNFTPIFLVNLKCDKRKKAYSQNEF